MWKWVLIGLAVVITGGVAALGLLGIRMLRPELLQRDLTREFGVTGLTIGASTPADMEARFGPAPITRKESISTVYEYPEQGLLLRIDDRTGTLVWYELSSPALATGKGIRVGSTISEVRQAYGAPSTLSSLSSGLRARYHYGTAYVLEFRFDKDERLGRIIFFRA